MSVIYIISQILAFISFLLSLIAYHRKEKKNIMLMMVLSNVLYLLHYVFLQAPSWYMTKVLAILRDSVIIKKDKKKSYVLLLVFVFSYVVLWILNYENIFSILPLLAALIYIIVIWNWNELVVKKIACFCYIFWLVYNIYIGSIVASLASLISIISSFIAIIRFKNKKTSHKKDERLCWEM
jgi:hypothetical protein